MELRFRAASCGILVRVILRIALHSSILFCCAPAEHRRQPHSSASVQLRTLKCGEMCEPITAISPALRASCSDDPVMMLLWILTRIPPYARPIVKRGTIDNLPAASRRPPCSCEVLDGGMLMVLLDMAYGLRP